MNEGDVSLTNYATTHTILRDKRYFLDLTLTNANVSTIFGIANLIEGSERAKICYQMELGSISMMHYILKNPQGIFLALKISVEMDIILKL